MFDESPSTPTRSVSFFRIISLVGISAGLGAVVTGVYTLFVQTNAVPVVSSNQVVASESAKISTITVDVSGAVVHPGVFNLSPSSRGSDALAAAGGPAKNADPYFLHKTFNGAEKLSDGQKIYLPTKDEAHEITEAGEVKSPPHSLAAKVSINSSTVEELDGLKGIGAKRAEDIISNRPYSSLTELVSKKILTQTIFEAIKDDIEL